MRRFEGKKPTTSVETRALQLADWPRFMRLVGRGILLDSALIMTLDGDAPQASPLSPWMPARALHTQVTCKVRNPVIGQFRHEAATPHAQLTYLAPGLAEHGDDTPWLQLLDGLTAVAGQRGAHTLNAEVEERSPLFETMRRAGFALYARQELWRHPPSKRSPQRATTLSWQRAQAKDAPDIRRLLRSLIPPMLRQALGQPDEALDWLYREGDEVLGAMTLRRGPRAQALIPYLHPRLAARAYPLLGSALALTNERFPCYIILRRYQDWWSAALPQLGFARHRRQAVLVRHIALGSKVKRLSTEWLELLEKGITPVLECQPPVAGRRSA